MYEKTPLEYQTPYVSEAAVSLDLKRHALQQEVDRMKAKLREAKALLERAEEYDTKHPARSNTDQCHRVIRFRGAAQKALEALK